MIHLLMFLGCVAFAMWAAPRVVPGSGAPVPQISIALLTVICLILWQHWHP